MFKFYAQKSISGLEFFPVAKGEKFERHWESFMLSAPGAIDKVREACKKQGFDFSNLECAPQINDISYFYFGEVEAFEGYEFFNVKFVVDVFFRFHPFDKVQKLAIFSKGNF